MQVPGYKASFCSLMYPAPPLHRIKATGEQGTADSRDQFGSQSHEPWVCPRCSRLVSAVDFRKKPASTPFHWMWCEDCRADKKIDSLNKKQLKALEESLCHKQMPEFFTKGSTQHW